MISVEKNNVVIQLVYTSQKIKGQLKQKEHKPPIMNQQNFVYYNKCGLCDTEYAGLHLHQRVEERERSAISNHVEDERGKNGKETIGSNFRF